MKKIFTILLALCLTVSINTFGQKSQILIARNAVGKLQVSIVAKEDVNKQFNPIKEGLKAIESAEKDKRTMDWAETWAIKSYLNSYAALISNDDKASLDFYQTGNTAIVQARKLDRYDDNSGLIKASDHNLLIKKQNIGNSFYEDNNFKSAFENLKEVSDNFPADTTLSLNTAICALNLQMYNEAMIYFTRAVENGIKNPAVYQKIAQIYTSKFDDKAALKILNEGLSANPSNSGLLNDRINLLIDAGSYAQALDLIGNKLDAEEGNKLLVYLYGYLQQANKNNAKAIPAYNTALEKDPNFFDAMYQLGLAFVESSNEALKSNDADKMQRYQSFVNRAEIALERANEIDPNNKNAIQLLIDLYTKKNELDKVQALRTKLREF